MRTQIMDTILGCAGCFLFIGFSVFCAYILLFKIYPSIEIQSVIDLQNWAAHEGLNLISYKRVRIGQAGFFIGGTFEYRIVVEDSEGHRKSGWASLLGGRTPPEWVKVRWE